MKALVGTFSHEKTLVGAFFVIVKLRVNFDNLRFKLYLGLEADWGLTSCSGGRMLGTRTSVKVLLSRLCRDREGRSAWLGVGVVGVQKLVRAQ